MGNEQLNTRNWDFTVGNENLQDLRSPSLVPKTAVLMQGLRPRLDSFLMNSSRAHILGP
ncbi:hypothetical protein Dimus_030089, partial [Dionaea muscipula]